MIELFSYELSYTTLASLFCVALFIGLSKAGVRGLGMISVPLLAMAFGGRASVGIMLPMLIIADVFGVTYYHRHTDWAQLKKLFPWTIIGVLLGTWTGQYIDDAVFRSIMGVIIILSLGVMIWMQKSTKQKIPTHWWFAAALGVIAGFTTMVGNLAGSAMSLYLLSMRMPKNEFIGTAAWFFLLVNLFKVPFHIWSWHTISLDSALLGLLGLPFIAIGAYVGVRVIKKINDQFFRWFIMVMTAIAAILMIF